MHIWHMTLEGDQTKKCYEVQEYSKNRWITKHLQQIYGISYNEPKQKGDLSYMRIESNKPIHLFYSRHDVVMLQNSVSVYTKFLTWHYNKNPRSRTISNPKNRLKNDKGLQQIIIPPSRSEESKSKMWELRWVSYSWIEQSEKDQVDAKRRTIQRREAIDDTYRGS